MHYYDTAYIRELLAFEIGGGEAALAVVHTVVEALDVARPQLVGAGVVPMITPEEEHIASEVILKIRGRISIDFRPVVEHPQQHAIGAFGSEWDLGLLATRLEALLLCESLAPHHWRRMMKACQYQKHASERQLTPNQHCPFS